MDPQGIEVFQGTHPTLVQPWLANDAEQQFVPDPDYKITRKERKYRLLMRLEKMFGWDLSKCHYKPLK